MGSILSKLFGGGGNHSHGSGAQQQPPPPALLPPTGGASTSTSSQHQQQSSAGTPLPRSTSSASSKHPPTPTAVDGLTTSVPPAPINILEVEVDEEAFKEVVSPPIYTSTIKAQIAPSPPHPLELQQHGAAPKPILVSHLATVDVPNGRQQAAPIATLDSDYEDEQLILEQESAEIEEAVIKIQAGVRGYLVRKHHANQSAKLPIKSISLDESVLLKQQQQQSPENILPPPESFESIVAISAVSNSSKPLSIQSKHRVETPIPGSPPFAQDDTNYRILDTDVDILQETVQSVQSTTVVPLIANPEELEIFKKINEINQLLASKDDDEAIAVIPEPPKQQPQPPVANLHQSTAATTMNSAVSSSSINKALSELDQTIHEQEMSLPPEEEDVVDAKKDDEVIVLESAFSDVPLSEPSSTVPPVPMSPSVLVKAPSLDEEEVPEEESLLGESLLSETAAAIRIQAAFRGYEVRKSLSREVSPARSTEEEKVVVVEEMAEVKVAEPKEEPAQSQPAAALTEPVPAAAATETEESKGGEAAKPTAEDFAEVLSLIPQPVNEELIPVMELSDQDIIEDYVEEKQPEGEEKLADNAQIITSGGEEQQPKQPQQQPATDADVNVAVKEGFGTLASSAKAAEAVVVVATAEEKKEEKATAAAAQVPVPDIEKSIKELEKSFDRDLLADVASEATAAVEAAVATAAAAATAHSPATPATPIIIETNSVSNSSQQLSITGEEKESLISIEPPTPEISTSQQQQAPAFSTEQQTPAPAPEQLPSKIPILDRANKSILKEPSSPEPHTYSTNLSPLLLSSPADGSGGNDENSDDESCSTPSPIPLRSSSPSPFSKKRPRRHRKKK